MSEAPIIDDYSPWLIKNCYAAQPPRNLCSMLLFLLKVVYFPGITFGLAVCLRRHPKARCSHSYIHQQRCAHSVLAALSTFCMLACSTGADARQPPARRGAELSREHSARQPRKWRRKSQGKHEEKNGKDRGFGAAPLTRGPGTVGRAQERLPHLLISPTPPRRRRRSRVHVSPCPAHDCGEKKVDDWVGT